MYETGSSTVRPGPGLQSIRNRLAPQSEKWLFLAPVLVVVLTLAIFPLIFSLVLVFSTWDLSRIGVGLEFSGLANLQRALDDERFWGASRVTLAFVLLGTPLEYAVALLLALVLNQELRFKKIFRVLFLIPLMISPVATGYVIGKLMFDFNGPINYLLLQMGVDPVNWLGDKHVVLFTLLMVSVWHSTPFMLLLLLAGLQSLPAEPFEAARVDGASPWQIFRYQTFPMLAPVSATAIFLRIIMLFQIIDIIVVVTGGGPGSATTTMTLLAAHIGMVNMDLGYASTLAVILLLMVAIVSAIFLGFIRKRLPEIA